MHVAKFILGAMVLSLPCGWVQAASGTIAVHPIHRTLSQTVFYPTSAQVAEWHAQVVEELAVQLVPEMVEYGCTNRSELVLAHLLAIGVPTHALGRMSSFYDVVQASQAATNIFRMDDPLHGADFQHAWNGRFGADVSRSIIIEEGLPLDVSGTVQWSIGHIAPTITARGDDGEIIHWVIDPVLSPAAPLTPEAWRARQQAPQATLLWGKVGRAPHVLPAYLTPEKQMELAGLLGIVSTNPPDLDAALASLSTDARATVQAQLMAIESDASWHPKAWHGYSFVGSLTDEKGRPLPDWDTADNHIADQRVAAANARLAPLRHYYAQRQKYDDAADFLAQAVEVRDGLVRLK